MAESLNVAAAKCIKIADEDEEVCFCVSVGVFVCECECVHTTLDTRHTTLDTPAGIRSAASLLDGQVYDS